MDKIAVDFLTNKENYYLLGNPGIDFNSTGKIERKDIVLYRVDEVSFEDRAPRKEALENVLSAMRINGINFIYLVLGNGSGVHFYYGAAKDFSYKGEDNGLSVQDIGRYILEPGIKGNFRGSKTVKMEPLQEQEIIDYINGMKYYSVLEGVPGYTKEDEKFQSADRLADVMLGDNFGFMVIASPLNYSDITDIENNLYEVYTKIVPFSKKSLQDSTSSNTGKAVSESQSTSENTGRNYSKTSQESISTSEGTNTGESKSTSKGTSKSSGSSSSSSGTNTGASENVSSGKNYSTSKTTGGSQSEGTSTSEGTSKGISTQTSSGEGRSNTTTIELVDRKVQEWIKYLDDIIIPRLDYGTGKGVFITSFLLFSDSRANLKKLENTAVSLYSGETGNKVPLMAVPVINNASNNKLNMLKNFQLPSGKFIKEISKDEVISRSALSQFVNNSGEFKTGNWITTNELAIIAGLPQKDVAGLGLREEVEFGLNFDNNVSEKNRINLGKLVQSGNEIEQIDVFLDKENLDKHMFITGVTGSGKTTTCHKILLDSFLPFLVIEPAKTEYRILAEQYNDLVVFTLGKDTVTPFRLNPFEFFPHESITSRVDMICASIEAAFDMEAAIPQIIETAIYECYKDYGWDIATNKNFIYGEEAFSDGVYAFPVLEDLIHKVSTVVEGQGFDDRLKNDYIGSIKARLSGLLAGAKGLMLNVRRSIDFKDLLDRRVVLELEEIRSATEKSLIMGFILINLVEAIKAKYKEGNGAKHITLVEEAHRLLSKYVPGDSPNKKHGVETFSDMLAEIRKYGESLIIVDQIPNKLTPEVLKNTNTKIVHRLFAEDDKDAIGNTIVLNHEQKEFLSNLETGRAIVFTQGFSKAIQVQVKSETNTTSKVQIAEEKLQEIVYKYYADNYKHGIIMGTQFFSHKPSIEEISGFIELSRDQRLKDIIPAFCRKPVCNTGYAGLLKEYLNKYNKEVVGMYMAVSYYLNAPCKEDRQKAGNSEKHKIVIEFITKYAENNIGAMEAIKYKNELLVKEQ